MEQRKEFKYIKGRYEAGMPADICFYTDVDYWSVEDFLYEFDYLMEYVCPSKIRVHINSVGGNVVDGMSVFAKIRDCRIPTECVNDALAASMGSIIWAAGDELYMKDYALLMIHNPFVELNGAKQRTQATEAFTKQLKTIYMQRFGLSEEEVSKIMDGEEGDDGTFMTASEAVERGFLAADHVIETPKAVKSKVAAALSKSGDVRQMRAVFASLLTPLPAAMEDNKNNNHRTKMEKDNISVFAALLGLTGDKATADNVSAKIDELKVRAASAEVSERDLKAAKDELAKVSAELTGAQTSVKNLSADLDKVRAELKEYRDAEAKAQAAKVDALIDEAISQCKINKDERALYVQMAQGNFALAENVLAKIPTRQTLSKAAGAASPSQLTEAMMTEEEKLNAKVKAVVGEDFKFRKLGQSSK